MNELYLANAKKWRHQCATVFLNRLTHLVKINKNIYVKQVVFPTFFFFFFLHGRVNNTTLTGMQLPSLPI